MFCPTVGTAIDGSQAGILFLQNLQVTHHFNLEENRQKKDLKFY